LSYDNLDDGGLTPLERATGLWDIMYGNDDGECSCGECEECVWRHHNDAAKQKIKLNERKTVLENSARFKVAAKLVAGISGNREIKFALIQKVHHDSMDSAIVQYMANEALPAYYAAILKSPNCIGSLVEGVLYRVCKLKASQTLTEQIGSLSGSMRSNQSRITVYDRVTLMQQFIHQTVDHYLGVGAARSIPVPPMKNALSAARLHLGIFDVSDRRPGYVVYLDSLSAAALQLEYDEPRQSTAPFGKRSWPRWRVRHLRPLSYYFPQKRRALLQVLRSLDESTPAEQFVNKALLLYAEA